MKSNVENIIQNLKSYLDNDINPLTKCINFYKEQKKDINIFLK